MEKTGNVFIGGGGILSKNTQFTVFLINSMSS